MTRHAAVSGIVLATDPPVDPIAGSTQLIIAALIDTGIGSVVAVFIRLATGSATVATVTAAGILAPLVNTLSTGETSLLVLAIGSGSLFSSHVNDAGFWLVKEYFGLTVGQNLKTWSLMETVISVSGLVFVLLLGLAI